MIGNPVLARATSTRARIAWAFLFALLAVTGLGLIIVVGMSMRDQRRSP